MQPPGSPTLTETPQTTPSQLVAGILAGELQAEDALIARFRRGVTFVIRRLVRDPSEADEVFQETFRLALTKIREGELRDSERLAGFMVSLARNLAIGHLRRLSRRGDLEVREFTGAENPSPGESQLERLLRRERAGILRRAIGELNNFRDRELLLRFYIAEEPKEEICRSLDLSSLHFNRVLYRARQRFRRLLEERGDGLGSSMS